MANFGKVFDYASKGVTLLGIIGGIYDIFDKPRKEREEIKFVYERVNAEVNHYMTTKIDSYIDRAISVRVDAEIEKRLAQHDDIIINSINDKLTALVSAAEMRKVTNETDAKKENNGKK